MYLVNKVNFNTNGGSSIDSIDVPYSLTLEEPTIPTKEGYIFNGWYEDEDKTVAFDFNKEITEDITLYAKWTKEYKFIKGDNQELTTDNISEYTFTIDGDYSLFESLTIGDLNLIKDEDYKVNMI